MTFDRSDRLLISWIVYFFLVWFFSAESHGQLRLQGSNADGSKQRLLLVHTFLIRCFDRLNVRRQNPQFHRRARTIIIFLPDFSKRHLVAATQSEKKEEFLPLKEKKTIKTCQDFPVKFKTNLLRID